MRAALGTSGPLLRSFGPVMGPATSAFDADLEKGAREEKHEHGDTLGFGGAAFRQDSPIDGAVGYLVGEKFTPDPLYNPFDEKGFKEVAEGIAPEFHNDLLRATSRNHAFYIRDRLLQKQADLQKLGDLGVGGNIGRFALGLLDPANLATGVAGGVVTRAASLARRAVATQVVAGIGGAAVGGYAFERYRQSVNFEDSQVDALIAGLMGTAFAAPFVGINARQMARVRGAAQRELDTLIEARSGNEPTAESLARAAYVDADAKAKVKEEGDMWEEHDRSARLDKIELQAEREAAAQRLKIETEAQQAGKNYARRRAVAENKQRDTEANAKLRALTETALADAPEGAMADAFARALKLREVQTPEAPHVDPTDEIRALLHSVREAQDSVPSIPSIKSDNAQSIGQSRLGDDVQFSDDEGRTIFGTVVREGPNGTLVVEHADTGRLETVNVRDLDGEPVDVPEGFLAGSVGGAQVSHVGVDRTAFSATRFDMHARLNRSENKPVQVLNELMTKDAIQKSDFYAQERTASEEKKLLQSRLAGNFHFVSEQAYDDAAKALGYNVFQKHSDSNVRHFFESAGRLARGETGVLSLGDNARIEPQLRQVSQAYRAVMDEMLDQMKKAGVKGAADVAENPAYVNRIWQATKIRELMSAHGEDNVVKLLANAIRIPGKHGDMDTARNVLNTILRLEHSHLSHDLLLHAQDMGTLRTELKRAKVSDAEIDSIVETMFEVKEVAGSDKGNAQPNMKFRFKIDETETLDVNGHTIAVADLLENDARVLMDRYMNSMAGHTAMAKKGILSRGDFEARIREAEKDHEVNGLSRDAGKFQDEIQMLRDIYNNITGRPMSVHSFNTGDRAAGVLRGFARMSYLGQLGFTAANELWHAASMMTFNAAMKQMPSIANFIRAVRFGHVPGDALAEDLRLMIGFGTEHTSNYARQHEITNFTHDKKLTWLENASNKGSHVIDKLSGNSFFTSYSRGLAAKFATQKYVHFATGKLTLDAAARKRLVGQGIHADDIDSVMSGIRKYTDMDANGRVDAIRWEDWSAKDSETYHAFTTAIQREVRGAIQDHDIGETWYFQHTAIGKIFTELRFFNIAAHSKQFLNSLHYRDHRTLHLWLTGMVTQSLAYVLQTSLNYAHDPEKRTKMLTNEKIAFAAFKRMSVTGLLPMMAEPFLPTHLTGLTANTENRMPWITPSMMLAGKTVAGAGAGVQALLYGENFTGKDVKNAATFIPNLYGVRNLVDMVSKMAPKSELTPTP